MEANMGQIPILDKCQMQFPKYTNHIHIFLCQYLGWSNIWKGQNMDIENLGIYMETNAGQIPIVGKCQVQGGPAGELGELGENWTICGD